MTWCHYRLSILSRVLFAAGLPVLAAYAQTQEPPALSVHYAVNDAKIELADSPYFRLRPDDALIVRVKCGLAGVGEGTFSLKQLGGARDLEAVVVVHPEQALTATFRADCAAGNRRDLDLVLVGPEAGRAYAYAVEFSRAPTPPTAPAPPAEQVAQFYVRVDERVHVELVAGPALAGGTMDQFEFTKLDAAAEGQPARGVLRTREAQRALQLAVGGAFRPWGYDPRGPLDWDNALFFLGLPVTSDPLERVYAGLGWGARGFHLIGGVSLFRQTSPRGSVMADAAFDIADGRDALDDYVRRRWTAGLFGTMQVDLGAFRDLFPKTSLNR